jgi:hypothetical protein
MDVAIIVGAAAWPLNPLVTQTPSAYLVYVAPGFRVQAAPSGPSWQSGNPQAPENYGDT